MDVTYNDYADHLIGQNSFEVIGAAEVADSNHQYQSRDDFRVRMPDIKFEVILNDISSVLLTIFDFSLKVTQLRVSHLRATLILPIHCRYLSLVDTFWLKVRDWWIRSKFLSGSKSTVIMLTVKSYLLHLRTVQPGEEARVKFSITPRTSGDKTISAKFISKELGPDVDGYRSVRVARNYSIRSDFNSNIL